MRELGARGLAVYFLNHGSGRLFDCYGVGRRLARVPALGGSAHGVAPIAMACAKTDELPGEERSALTRVRFHI
jgi:hypothetical protein